ncbi:DinB family protein [Flavobacterium sedimenticola]|uniref:DinB family protein n=1 Tax=Flavobacterium sedimenticola TaxID=3043286 RepID=A0ABT6XNW1_9FLAO|nr:DinB family protein [Flavobacterium sedimenticola]MDI9256781.1 DinB family protein [Flavobacterium sedimenticola]
MKINAIELLEDLQSRTLHQATIVRCFITRDDSDLRYKADSESWSVLECIAHLNCYYTFYLPLLREALSKSTPHKGVIVFKTGFLGNYFVRLMETESDKVKKMKAVPAMNPNHTILQRDELSLFIEYQSEFTALLNLCKAYDISAPTIPTVLSKWVTLSLGDTLRFIVAHNERHLLQAQNRLLTIPVMSSEKSVIA